MNIKHLILFLLLFLNVSSLGIAQGSYYVPQHSFLVASFRPQQLFARLAPNNWLQQSSIQRWLAVWQSKWDNSPIEELEYFFIHPKTIGIDPEKTWHLHLRYDDHQSYYALILPVQHLQQWTTALEKQLLVQPNDFQHDKSSTYFYKNGVAYAWTADKIAVLMRLPKANDSTSIDSLMLQDTMKKMAISFLQFPDKEQLTAFSLFENSLQTPAELQLWWQLASNKDTSYAAMQVYFEQGKIRIQNQWQLSDNKVSTIAINFNKKVFTNAHLQNMIASAPCGYATMQFNSTTDFKTAHEWFESSIIGAYAPKRSMLNALLELPNHQQYWENLVGTYVLQFTGIQDIKPSEELQKKGFVPTWQPLINLALPVRHELLLEQTLEDLAAKKELTRISKGHYEYWDNHWNFKTYLYADKNILFITNNQGVTIDNFAKKSKLEPEKVWPLTKHSQTIELDLPACLNLFPNEQTKLLKNYLKNLVIQTTAIEATILHQTWTITFTNETANTIEQFLYLSNFLL